MSDANKAVFLSYASQDAEAARRICEALRSAGVEVWFDQSELRGGDSWDAKIRKQIKECALFIPVISANTQSRPEGYFRLEWRLADQRTHLMGKNKAFLMPVCVDATRDVDADVPDSFAAVQWTKLPGGETPPAFGERVKKLMSGRTVVGVADPDRISVSASPVISEQTVPNKISRPWLVSAIIGTAAIIAAVVWQPWRKAENAIAIPTPPVSPTLTAAPAGQFPRDPDLVRALQLVYSLNAIPEDFALADDLVKPVLETRPNDPEVVTVAAMVSQEFLTRGFDTSEVRRGRVQRLTERAVQLAPNNPDALAALSHYLLFIGTQLPRAEELVRRAIESKPDEPRYYRVLLQVLNQSKPGEAEAFAVRMVARFPHDALVQYDVARSYKDRDVVAMEQAIDRTLAIGPVANAMIWKSWLLLEIHGDVAGMKAWLDRVPERQRTNVRFANALGIYGIVSGDTTQAIKVLQDLPDTWLTDFEFHGPKALLLGNLLTVAGRKDQARLHYDSALAEIQRAEAANPTDLRLRNAELWTLLGLERRTEAKAVSKLLVETRSGSSAERTLNFWWNSIIRANVLLGEREQALALLKEAASAPAFRPRIRQQIDIDPAMAPYRHDPEIVTALAEPGDREPAATANQKIDAKSVAVLAFANLSDDKGNEYFSDGISEELLNVLAKIPGLKVSARTSAFYFKGKQVPIPEIAQKLGVAYVVEGSVQRAGDKVRVTAQLIKAADGYHVWSDHFDRELKDVFALQDEIAGLIAKNLSLKLGASFAVATRAVDPRAFELYMQGRQAWNLRSTEGFARAEQLLNRAIELSPDFTRAHIALADVAMIRGENNGVFGAFGQRNSPEVAGIVMQIQRVLALDPELAEAHASLGNAYSLSWNFVEAEQSLRRAIALNPNYATAHQWLAFPLYFVGRVDDALSEQKLAAELDPLSPRILDNLGHGLRRVGRYREALAAFDRALALRPNWPEALGGKALTCLALGRWAEAIALVRQLPSENLSTAGFQILVLGQAGLRTEAEALLAGWDSKGTWPQAQSLLAIGRREEALAALDASQERLEPEHTDILLDPLFDSIRDDPRFAKFIATLGWAEAHARTQAWRKAHPPEKPVDVHRL